MTHARSAFRRLAAAVLVAATLTGCTGQRKAQHDAWVDEAHDRWNDIKVAQVLVMARQKFETGDLDLAEDDVKTALAQAPKNAHLHMLLGQIDLERSKLERAFQEFTFAVEYDPTLAQAYYLRGIVLQRISRLDLALADYQKAFELEGDNAGYLLAVAETMVSLNRGEEAIALLTPHLDSFDANASLRMMMGHIHALRHDYDKAAEFFRLAAMLDPENPRPREELAAAQMASGKTIEAARTLEALLGDAKLADRGDLRRSLASAYVRINRLDDARDQYLKVARSAQGVGDDWVKLAELAVKAGKDFDSLYASRKAIELEPMNPQGYLLAGMTWQRQGRLDEALQMFDRAAELSPQDAAPLILRGLSLQEAGKHGAAAESYRQALTRSPQDERARRLLDSLSSAQP